MHIHQLFENRRARNVSAPRGKNHPEVYCTTRVTGCVCTVVASVAVTVTV